MIISAIFFVSLIGYSRLIDEKGSIIFKFYKYQLVERFKNLGNNINSIQQIKETNYYCERSS